MARKNALASYKKLQRKRIIFRIFAVFFVLFALSAAVVGFFRIPFLKIKEVKIEGNRYVDAEAVSLRISNQLNGNYLVFIPKKNILILPKEELAEIILEDKRIRGAEIDRDFFGKIIIKISERTNEALLCQRENCAFIDKDGFVFEKSPYYSGEAFLKFFDERMENASSSGPVIDEVETGKNLLPEEQFSKIMEFIKESSAHGVAISELALKPDGVYEMRVNEGWIILLNGKNNLKEAYLNLITVLGSEIKDNRKKLDYIDLRFGNKVYFKYN